jgi:RHS repeat-associated protein
MGQTQAGIGDRALQSCTPLHLGRLTSENNPETGAVTYSYDTDATCVSTSNGDLVKKIDAASKRACYFYDALHRVTSITYSDGTPSKYYVYDSATINVNGSNVTMAYAQGRLAEAYTGSAQNKTTDLGFSYSVRGEVADVYQKSPNSGGYYHVGGTYWAHGSLNVLSGLPGLPTITYGVDGEGRTATASASSGQSPITSSTSYNVSGQATGVTLGSADSDAFSYDPNTSRMSQYQFNVNGQSLTGVLTWNSNGTLRTLAITDPFNSANSQTCNYSYDDLARLFSIDCGASTWQQNFGYDAFGNLKKTVPPGGTGVSFQPTYNLATNRMSNLSGFTPTYDTNGNTTADSLHTYAWDAEGRPVTIDAIGLTYDALGRMVEQNRSGSYTQIVYAPGGGKLALMNGQTLSKAFVTLPAGAAAVYNSSGLSYYRHSDWLGSSRFASMPSRAMYSDLAYAPFGETYAEAGTADRSFTGQNQDTSPGSTAGMYDFLFRQYSQYGRWTSPDPAGLAAVNLSNPQSLNRYAYVMNNPTTATDPLGLMCDLWCLGDLGGGGGGGFCGQWGGPEGDICILLLAPPIFIGGGGGGGGNHAGGGGGTGGTTGSGSGPNTGGLPPMGGETNGIPNWFPAQPLSMCQLTGLCPISPGCEFGFCVPLGTGFIATGLPARPIPYYLKLLYLLGDLRYGGDPGPPRLKRASDELNDPCSTTNRALAGGGFFAACQFGLGTCYPWFRSGSVAGSTICAGVVEVGCVASSIKFSQQGCKP